MNKFKDRFYSIIYFLSSEIHLFEYIFYSFVVAFAFYLFRHYDFPVVALEKIVSIIIALAFMNTWEIKARSFKKKKSEEKKEND